MYVDQVTHVHDGDTFTAASSGRVRLANVNAPELTEPGGYQAWLWLRYYIDGQTVTINPVAHDVYARTVATVWSNGVNVNMAMRARGYT